MHTCALRYLQNMIKNIKYRRISDITKEREETKNKSKSKINFVTISAQFFQKLETKFARSISIFKHYKLYRKDSSWCNSIDGKYGNQF